MREAVALQQRVAVAGALGRMGRTVCRAVMDAPDMELVGAADPAFGNADAYDDLPGGLLRFLTLREALAATRPDAVVDFTRPDSALDNILACLAAGAPAVVGTTGLSADNLDLVDREARSRGVPVLYAPNFALGAVLMMEFARVSAQHLSSAEIIELHHDRKLDAPSGTAKRTAELIEGVWRNRSLERSPQIHSVRLPGLVAHQEVIFGGLAETLTIRHDSFSRECFMPGVLLALRRVSGLQGLVTGLENIL